MEEISTVGLDIAKSVFQVHAISDASEVVVRRQVKRRQVLQFFAALKVVRSRFLRCLSPSRVSVAVRGQRTELWEKSSWGLYLAARIASPVGNALWLDLPFDGTTALRAEICR